MAIHNQLLTLFRGMTVFRLTADELAKVLNTLVASFRRRRKICGSWDILTPPAPCLQWVDGDFCIRSK
jgi:hypothetical protein